MTTFHRWKYESMATDPLSAKRGGGHVSRSALRSFIKHVKFTVEVPQSLMDRA